MMALDRQVLVPHAVLLFYFPALFSVTQYYHINQGCIWKFYKIASYQTADSYNYLITLKVTQIEGWEWKRSKCIIISKEALSPFSLSPLEMDPDKK